jgi:hypothetical protein
MDRVPPAIQIGGINPCPVRKRKRMASSQRLTFDLMRGTKRAEINRVLAFVPTPD